MLSPCRVNTAVDVQMQEVDSKKNGVLGISEISFRSSREPVLYSILLPHVRSGVIPCRDALTVDSLGSVPTTLGLKVETTIQPVSSFFAESFGFVQCQALLRVIIRDDLFGSHFKSLGD